jgi:flagellar hook-length control protein FliK
MPKEQAHIDPTAQSEMMAMLAGSAIHVAGQNTATADELTPQVAVDATMSVALQTSQVAAADEQPSTATVQQQPVLRTQPTAVEDVPEMAFTEMEQPEVDAAVLTRSGQVHAEVQAPSSAVPKPSVQALPEQRAAQPAVGQATGPVIDEQATGAMTRVSESAVEHRYPAVSINADTGVHAPSAEPAQRAVISQIAVQSEAGRVDAEVILPKAEPLTALKTDSNETMVEASAGTAAPDPVKPAAALTETIRAELGSKIELEAAQAESGPVQVQVSVDFGETSLSNGRDFTVATQTERPRTEAVEQPDVKPAFVLLEPNVASKPQAAVGPTGQVADTPRPDHVRMIDQVVGQVKLVKQGERREITVRLTPPELGTLHIQVAREGNVLTSHIQASTEQVRGLLQAHVQTLVDGLADAGLRMQSVSISSNSSFAAFSDQAQGGNGQQFQQSNHSNSQQAFGFGRQSSAMAGSLPRTENQTGYSWLA